MNYPKDFKKIPCPVEKTVILIGNKWSLLIIRDLSRAKCPMRFNQILKSLKINSKTLSIKLCELVDYGIIEKKIFAEIPPRTEYTLTDKGKDLCNVLYDMEIWSRKWHSQNQPVNRQGSCNNN
ncbi:MAG: helix-turn-helix transcriptional regulator [Candidatus Methanoperedens sp.]|nr:helix-turn-helix transcriptional regulator [Candidatus Methanoperedens sp.]